MRTKELWSWIAERESIRRKKEAGKVVLTVDPILRKYRFCNVHRENDRVTKALARLVRSADKDAWFAIVVSRLLNNPDSVKEVRGYIVDRWDPRGFVSILQNRRALGCKIFNAAYIVSTNGVAMDKVEYLAERVLNPLWDDRKHLRSYDDDELFMYHARLMEYDGLGSFIAAQVVADAKFCDTNLKKALDWSTWAASGPGSRRGLNRVMDQPYDQSWNEKEWKKTLDALKKEIDKKVLASRTIEAISAQDLQNCLCEFDKYERTRAGDGTPKQLYKPYSEKE